MERFAKIVKLLTVLHYAPSQIFGRALNTFKLEIEAESYSGEGVKLFLATKNKKEIKIRRRRNI